MLARRIALLALPALLLPACGEPASSPRPETRGAVQRLDLEFSDEVAVIGSKGRLLTAWVDLTDEATTADWDFGGVETNVLPFEDKSVLAFARTGPASIRVPAELEFENTPKVVLFGLVRGEGFKSRIRLVKDGATVATGTCAMVKSRSVQGFEFEFEHTPKVGGGPLVCDALVLEIPQGRLPVGLVSMKVEDLPIGSFLPQEAFGGLALIEQLADGRRGTLLSNDSDARASFRVEDATQVLRFDHTIPKSVASLVSAPKLRLSLEVDGVAQEDVVLEPTTDWSRHAQPVGAFAGSEVTASFSVEVEDDGRTLVALGRPTLVRPLAEPPSVLLITSDTHRSDHVGYASGPDGPRTQTIDRLAAEGVSFLDTISSINNTTPSHAALLTGLPPRDTGIVSNAKRLAEEAPTIADCFAELGYATIACVSAAPICSEFSGLDQGFDRYSNPGFRSVRDGAETVQQLLDWLPDYEGQPLFVWLHLYDAHAPYDPPAELLHEYYSPDLRPYDPASPVANLDLAPYWDTTIADPVYTESLYKGEVHYVDDRLAQLFDSSRLRDGIIAFTADHGEALRTEASFRFNHNVLARDTLAIPLIFLAPGLDPGEKRDVPVNQTDVGRTLLDLAGHADVEFPGRNVLTVEEGEEGVRFAMEGNGYSAAVIRGKWMLRLGLRPTRSATDKRRDWFHQHELIDWTADGTGEHDVSAEHPEVTKELRAILVQWLSEGVRGRWMEEARGNAADIARQLAELGYTGADEGVDEPEPWMKPNCQCTNCQAAR